MKLTIENIKIRNFKGIKEQDIEFDLLNTTICGDNGTGKTTVVDAFNWLLFEKDSKGRSQFEIKTLTKEGQTIHGLEHSVEATFKIDGRGLKLKKIYKEIWTLKKGDTQETFTGHEIERFINEVPVKKMEYERKINELIDEKIFQLLTDPLYFSRTLHWKERRKALFELAGGSISKEEVFKIKPSLKAIEKDLEDKTIDDLKETLKYQRRQLNKEREDIPVKITTLHETIKKIDRTVLDVRIRSTKGSIDQIEEKMTDATKMGEDQLEKQSEIYELKTKQKEIEHQIKQGIKDPDEATRENITRYKNELREIEIQAQGERRTLDRLDKMTTKAKEEVEQLRKDYSHETNKKIEMNEDIKECPTCRRPFAEEEIAETISKLEENFKENQVKALKRLREVGLQAAKELEKLEEELEEAKNQLAITEGKIEDIQGSIKEQNAKLGSIEKADLQTLLAENQEYQQTRSKIEKLTAEINNRGSIDDTQELKAKKTLLEAELKELEKDLHQEEINKETETKIEKLMEKETELSQQISEIEKKQFLADEYTSTKAELIEKSINGKFKEVSFRLFKKQTNGGLDETCEALVAGVPFDNANTAGQVNAGLNIINSLCQHYETYTPIFIDNRESVNELIDTNSQLINLKVTKHKALRIETL